MSSTAVRPTDSALALASGYRLALAHVPRRGAAGERLGKGTGASVEIQDRRAYVAGDDVRHVDWRAFARTDQLLVKLHREEIAPHLDLLLDGSRSMAVGDDKAPRAVDLTALFAEAARAEGFTPRVVLLGDRTELVDRDRLLGEGVPFEGRTPLEESVRAAAHHLRAASVRLVLSDFLSPHEAPRLVRTLAARAGGLGLVQVLGSADESPEEGAAVRLTDAETGAALDLVLDRRAIGRYVDRLARLGAALAEETRRVGGAFTAVRGAEPLRDSCRGALARDGFLAPA